MELFNMEMMRQIVSFSILAVFLNLITLCQAQAEPSLNLETQHVVEITEKDVWHKVISPPVSFTFSDLKSLYSNSPRVEDAIVGSSGDYIARIVVKNNQRSQTWFINPTANFIDIGIAYWEKQNGTVITLDEFSQLKDVRSPTLMHAQSFSFTPDNNEQGYLWIYISAKHYTNPLSLKASTNQAFYRNQFIVNTVTVAAISVMLTLMLIAISIYIRTRQNVTLACAGYIGLHGLGWAAASGLLNDMLPLQSYNLTYGGIMIFPFAIASASQFTKLLFDGPKSYRKLAYGLNILSIVCVGIGLIIPWLNFSIAFTISHFIALFWISLSIVIGIKMLKKEGLRAKYYLSGNLFYSASLAIYMLSHVKILHNITHTEIIVLSALAIDCICIMLSLAEWLRKKQTELNQFVYLARIDPLTNIGNRYSFNEKLLELKQHFVIVFIDFDDIKSINDKLGHNVGDLMLSKAASLMKQKLVNKGEVFRTGGDEFVWLFNVTETKSLTALTIEIDHFIKQCQQELRKTWPTAGISHGVATSQESKNQSQCLKLADDRMYQNKRGKKLDILKKKAQMRMLNQ
jgi:diguanylate cyclase (GGDEF)-like protein